MEPRRENMPKIENLSEAVIGALDYFERHPVPHLDIDKYKRPFVVGSGNAINTGKIIFSGRAAIFADQSDFKSMVSSNKDVIDGGFIKDAVIISASGEKDSIWETEFAKQNGLRTTLVTNKGESSAAKIADEVIACESRDEPYTYNTSTYMGMILASTGENPREIKNLIQNVQLPDDFAQYDSFSFVLPDRFATICPMLEIKRHELFGPKVSLRAFPEGDARHAKFVILDDKELVISVGFNNDRFGMPQSRWDIQLPDGASFGTVMALTYWLVGRMQAVKPPYFMENIARYVSEDGPRAYGEGTKPFDLIVPGTAKEE